jgi:hypothetical protein
MWGMWGILSCLEIDMYRESKLWWEGREFEHPVTKNKVKFTSLPPEEQKKLNQFVQETKEMDKVKKDIALEKKVPEKKVPDKKVPEKKVPEKKVPEKEVPEKEVPDKKVPEKKVPEKKVPEKKVPEKKVPDKKVKKDKFQKGVKDFVDGKTKDEGKKKGVAKIWDKLYSTDPNNAIRLLHFLEALE